VAAELDGAAPVQDAEHDQPGNYSGPPSAPLQLSRPFDRCDRCDRCTRRARQRRCSGDEPGVRGLRGGHLDLARVHCQGPRAHVPAADVRSLGANQWLTANRRRRCADPLQQWTRFINRPVATMDPLQQWTRCNYGPVATWALQRSLFRFSRWSRSQPAARGPSARARASAAARHAPLAAHAPRSAAHCPVETGGAAATRFAPDLEACAVTKTCTSSHSAGSVRIRTRVRPPTPRNARAPPVARHARGCRRHVAADFALESALPLRAAAGAARNPRAPLCAQVGGRALVGVHESVCACVRACVSVCVHVCTCACERVCA
jgi:hypothetical protein